MATSYNAQGPKNPQSSGILGALNTAGQQFGNTFKTIGNTIGSGIGAFGAGVAGYTPPKILAPLTNYGTKGIGPFANPKAYDQALSIAPTASSTPSSVSTTSFQNTPPPDMNTLHQSKVDAINAQIKSAKDQLSQAQQGGYGPNEQIQKDAQGNVIPKNAILPPGAGYTPQYNSPNNQPTVGSIASQEANVMNNPSPQVTDYNKQIADLKQEYQKNLDSRQGQGGFLNEGLGGAKIAENEYSSRLSGLQQGLQNALVSQGQGLQGLNQAQQGVAPQPYGITQTPYNPATNSFGTLPGGSNGATGAGIVIGQVGAGETYAQNQAILGKVQAQLPALEAAIKQDNFNPYSLTYANQLQDWAKGTLSSSSIPEVQGSLNDIVGGLSQVLGVPSSSGSDFRLQFAGSIVNALQSGKSISDAINFAVNQAIAGNQGYLKGAQNASSTGQSSTGQPVSAGGYNFVQDANGNWVPK